MSKNSTRISCHINAPRARVYGALIDVNAIIKWKVPGIGLYVSFIDTEGNRVGMLEPVPMQSKSEE